MKIMLQSEYFPVLPELFRKKIVTKFPGMYTKNVFSETLSLNVQEINVTFNQFLYEYNRQ